MLQVDHTEVSNIAGRSEVTKVSKVAEVSAIVPVEDTSKFTSQFNAAMQENFERFREAIHEEYARMRSHTMAEYQTNYEINCAKKTQKIADVVNEIQTLDESIVQMKENKNIS